MKVALLTIWHEMNYGAELQAYATVKALRYLGHDVQMINLRLSDNCNLNIKGRIARFLSSFGPAQKKFNRFWDNYIPVTRRYRSLQELEIDPPCAEVYMAGSDQVWNPDITGALSDLYFLNFGSRNVRRVSYASSFGVDKWNYPQLVEDVKTLLSRFDYVTCRESSGVTILKDTFKVDSQLVLDPTLLFSDYSELIGNVSPKSTLVYYPLSNDPELVKYSESLAQKLNLTAVNNKRCTYVFKPIVWNRVGIEQWIKNIAQAQFVITRSFHGLAFALIYRKNFVIISSNNNRMTRITSLLSLLGLESRLFSSFQDIDDKEPWNYPIDYNTVDSKLSTLREHSWITLKKMME